MCSGAVVGAVTLDMPVLVEQRVDHLVHIFVVKDIKIFTRFEQHFVVLAAVGNLVALVSSLPLVSGTAVVSTSGIGLSLGIW